MSKTPEEMAANAEEIAQEAEYSEVTPRGNGEIAVRPVHRFAEYILERAERESQIVAQELSFNQMDAILSATTPEELDNAMKILGVVGLKDLDNGTEFEIQEFHVSPGTREEFRNQLGVFAVMRAVMLETGQTAFLDTGVERIITYLRACEAMERFPLAVRIVKQDTGRGNTMITLQPVRERVVRA